MLSMMRNSVQVVPMAASALAGAAAYQVGKIASQAYDSLKSPPAPPTFYEQLLEMGLERKKTIAVALFGAAAVGFWACKNRRRRVLLKPLSQESLVAGSAEMPALEPACQVAIAFESPDGTLVKVGSGVRGLVGCNHVLFTAAHNLSFEQPLWLIKGSKQVRLGDYSPIPLAADAALLLVPEKTFGLLGVKVANFSPLPGKSVAVSVTGLAGKGTTGILSPVVNPHHGIGHVTYAATTAGGYSGAPYVSGSQVYGIHIHGGMRNGGFEILYLYALAKIALEYTEEDTEDAFMERLFNSDDPDYYVQEVGDKVIVRVHGNSHYHVVDAKKFRDYEARWENADYSSDDYVEECASEALNFQSPGQRSRAGPSIECLHRQPQLVTSSCQTSALPESSPSSDRRPQDPSNKRLKKLINSRLRRLQLKTNGTRSTPSRSLVTQV
ncbi:hypothetical protein 1 [Shuangao sobemo-like virus 2]|uniref:hypothetical protein 1 n=1 Tax=Shuangao sobemo-like virus 2 TaxID=1923475 RepID=UPI00090B3FBC|nr:hypothetical protein 1 [Shuangao sobemo-like virus 2]APG75746.1 hypothetical protein 1 [Shuangao sobemo-like virus 2]